MNPFNSIKWRLQLWYGLILVAVLAGLGVAAFQLHRARVFRQVDGDLMRRANSVAAALRPTDMRPQRRQPGQPDGMDQPFFPPEEGRPGAGRPPFSGPFHMLPRDEGLFDQSDTNGFYFVVFARDGRELGRSSNAPAGVFPPANPRPAQAMDPGAPPLEPQPPRMRGGEPQIPVLRGTLREVRLQTGPGECIVIGRNIAAELAELRLAAVKLAGVGGIVLLLGLAGGWWIASRSLRPIDEISAAAAKISGGDLSQRINVAEAESELGRLAAVLNSTFARLETAFAQQKQFASDAAHELRTPVTVILTQTQGALNRERSAEDYRQTVEACQRAAQRMRRLIESLLELARFDAGQEVLKRLTFDLVETVSDSAEMVRALADERGVRIDLELQPVEIAGDPDRLMQVVTNLLTNAIQFSQAGGGVRVRLEAGSGLAVLAVSDTGQGIPPEDLPRVFERFYRGDKSRAGGNAGLGLAICKSIASAHGGTIEVASEPGAGSTFTLRLPL